MQNNIVMEKNKTPHTYESIEIHSEEVQDIIGRPFKKLNILAWGLIVVIFVCAIVCCIFVRCPDSVTARLFVTNTHPIVKIAATQQTTIKKVFVQNGEIVKKGTPLILYESFADYQDLLSLKKDLQDLFDGKVSFRIHVKKECSINYQLGEIQDIFDKYQYLLQQTISSHTTVLNDELKNAGQDVLRAIQNWQNQFVAISPINGKVTFLAYEGEHQFVEPGNILLSITPTKSGIPFGKALLSASNAGKIKQEQTCLVFLDKYPSEDFGNIKGQISFVSDYPIDNQNYLVTISFPHGLCTNFGKKIPSKGQMVGEVTIIINNRKLGNLIFEPLLKILTNPH